MPCEKQASSLHCHQSPTLYSLFPYIFSTLTLQLPRTALMLCLTKLSFTVKIFTERICCFTICHLIAIIAITSDSCLCWLRTAAETGDTFCQVPAVLHREKPEMMLSSVTQGTPTERPQILSLHLPEGFMVPPLVNLPSSRIISQ